MRHFIGTLAMVLALSAGSEAQTRDEPGKMVVLELFTSQGCSSCPPADDLLGEFAQHADVLALSFHVDYWDYIGWADTFGDPSNTRRQKVYAQNAGERMIYTPQIVVQGQHPMIGHKGDEITAALAQERDRPALVRLQVARHPDRLLIEVAPVAQPGPDAELTLIRFRPEATVRIGRGENAGQTLAYTNVVTEWYVVGYWSGEDATEITVPVTGDLPAAVVVQERGQGAVLAAARAR